MKGAMRKRRRIWPMPVEALIDSPDFLAMPAAGAGIVIRMALHFWQTDCRPLPVADHELRNIARAAKMIVVALRVRSL